MKNKSILTNFVEKNKIKLVLKKMYLWNKFLDITDQILNLLNEETNFKKLINETNKNLKKVSIDIFILFVKKLNKTETINNCRFK